MLISLNISFNLLMLITQTYFSNKSLIFTEISISLNP